MLSLSSNPPTPVDVRLSGSRWSIHSATAAEFTRSWPPTVSVEHHLSSVDASMVCIVPPSACKGVSVHGQ